MIFELVIPLPPGADDGSAANGLGDGRRFDPRLILSRELAKAGGRYQFDPKFWNHEPDGSNSPGRSLIAIAKRGGNIVLHGLGEEGSALLFEHREAIVSLYRGRFPMSGPDSKVKERIIVERITEAPQLRPYRITSLVFQRKHWKQRYAEAFTRGDFNAPVFLERIEHLITGGIHEQASHLSYDTPLVSLVNLQCEDITHIWINERKITTAVATVSFSAMVEIEGPWYVGGLTSKGFGLICKDFRGTNPPVHPAPAAQSV